MKSRMGHADLNRLLKDLMILQWQWERKVTELGGQREFRARGVLFGIETARRRIAEVASSPAELLALLDEWKRIGTRVATGPAAASVQGIDSGIRLVTKRVQRYLKQLPPRKPASSRSSTT